VKRSTRRLGAVLAAAVAVLAIAASPAFAHFCSKSGWSDSAFAHAAKSKAWATPDEMKGFLAEWEASPDPEKPCAAAFDDLEDQIDSRPEYTLFMGPGLLAGGTLHNDKDNTPEHVDHLDFEAAFALCGA
jgi:hypothetical protein